MWVKRLYFCLREAEKELGIVVIDASQDGQKWEKRLKTVFFQPQLCTNCTPFKGVTDLVFVGRNGFARIVSVAGNDD